MSTLLERKAEELSELRKKELSDIEMNVLTKFTLADAIRDGCKVTEKAETWESGDKVCALSAAVISARSRGYL